MEGGPYQEYFYIEIPVGAASSGSTGSIGEGTESDTASSSSAGSRVEKSRHRRFVYVQEESARKFPMQFGLEVSNLF